MLIVFIIVILFEIIFAYGVRTLYYGNIEQLLRDRLNVAVNIYDSYLGYTSLDSKAKFILESKTIPDYVDAQVIDKNSYIIDSTSRFTSGKKVETYDLSSALEGKVNSWYGDSKETGESLMAISAPIYEKNSIIGAIRFITSIERVDSAINAYYFIAFFIGITILFVAFIISIIIASKTVEPIYHLKSVADHYAIGDFDKKAIKFDEDELGELSDTFNYMANEIKEADKLKNDFISSISHEIRTPLTSILGWSETLLDGGSEEENKMGLEIIARESERLTKLVEDLLDFSKLEAKRVTIEKSRFDINNLVEKTGKQFYAIANKKGINLNVNTKNQKVLYNGDRDRIKQVLINVIDNAIKHTFVDGNIDIYLFSSGKKITIKIEDDGEGITDNQIGNITKMFYKGNKNISGSGIGLAISNKIIELHEGSIEFEAKETGGLIVNITLPRRTHEKPKNENMERKRK